MCAGAVGEQGPILAHALREISATGQTATKFCDAVFGLCAPPAVNAFSVPFPKAAPAVPKAFASSGRTPFQVVHISDVHIDRAYTVRCTPRAAWSAPIAKERAGGRGRELLEADML